MSTQRQVRRGTTAEIASMSTPAEGEWLYDTTRKAGVWGDGAEDDGIPSPNFAEVINNTWTGFTAVQNGSPADPNDLTITIDERFNKAAFLNGATFKTFARFYVKIPANNTGAVNLTVEFGSGGSTITKDLKKIDAAAAPAELDADDLVEGGIYSVVFDGTQWLVVGGLGGTGGGSWELIATATASADSQIDFTSGLTAFTDLRVVGWGLYTGSGNPALQMRFDQGSGFMTSYNKYRYAAKQFTLYNAESVDQQINAGQIKLLQSIYSRSDTEAAFEAVIRNANAAQKVHTVTWQAVTVENPGFSSDGGDYEHGGGGSSQNADTGAISGVRIFPASSTLTGELAIYGRNHA